MEDIPNKIVTLLGIVPEVNHVVMDGKDVVEIIVSTSNIPIPYRGVYYQRSGATKQELRGTALHDFLLSKMGVHWEDMACQRASLDDIDEDAIAYFLRKGIEAHRIDPEVAQYSKEQVLDNLELMEDGKPTNAAIMLFGKRPSRFFSTLDYKIGRFGSSNTDLRHQDMIVSNLITLGDKIMRLLSDNYLIHPIHYEGWTRMEPLEIPEEALREIVYNSIIHRDQRGAWTQMSIYDDHIRLWNDGVLPVGYTVDTLLGKHTSKPRNPTIAKIFYMAGFIEAWGRGIEKIVEGFTKENLTPPTFVGTTVRDGVLKPVDIDSNFAIKF